VLAAYESLADWSVEPLKAVVDAAAESHGLKAGKAQAPVRVAVTGRSVGPPLFEALALLGRDETLRRLRTAEATLG
jgi:glutamyl-tRNA synthetase